MSIFNGGSIRANIEKGSVTFRDIINVLPYGNYLCVIEVTGQQLLDVLEWGARSVPEQNAAFMQVSGMSYEVDAAVLSTCIADENNMFSGVAGERRVKNVKIGGAALQPEATYTLAGIDYCLMDKGDGLTVFDGCKLLQDRVKLDNQVLIDYFTDVMGGEISSDYADPYGQGRITILDEAGL